jgi:hypothetical protein
MIRLTLVLLPLLAATPDDGVSVAPVEAPHAATDRVPCPPPGYRDPKSGGCRPGCGIPIRWVKGVRTGGCGGDRDTLIRAASAGPALRSQLLPTIRDGG